MVYFETFDTLQEFASTINKRKINSTFKTVENCKSQRESERNTEITGTASYPDADSLLFSGDNENLAKLKRANVKSMMHSNDYTANMLKAQKHVCGCLPNIPLYLIGVPNNMLNFKRAPAKSKIINILVNIAVSYDITANQIIEAGANISSIIRELEKNGIRVNLYASCFANRKNDYIGFVINLKKSSAPLNMLNITYPLINPSMLRRHYFKFVETIPAKISSKFVGSYGQVISFNTMLKHEPKLNKYKDAIIIDMYDMIGASVSDMVKTISDKTK